MGGVVACSYISNILNLIGKILVYETNYIGSIPIGYLYIIYKNKIYIYINI